MTTALAQHWQPMLAATAAGLLLGVAFVAVSCLTPLIRLRLAANPAKRAHVLREEMGRLRQLGDAAAVLEEHGRAGTGDLRAEAELRVLILRRVLHLMRAGRGRRRRMRPIP